MPRSSEKIRAKILEAVGTLLSKKGFQAIGVNSVARTAGVDKVLIYRYFGGMQQLLRAYAMQGDFWPTLAQQVGRTLPELASMDAAELSSIFLVAHLRELRKRPITQEIIRWSLFERNELTQTLAIALEELGSEIINLLPFQRHRDSSMDFRAFGALILAGITHLVLCSKTAGVHLGMDIRSEEGWVRLERAIGTLVKVLFAHYQKEFGNQGA